MHDNSTGGRRGISAAIFALLLATAACGTATGADTDSAVPAAPAVVKQAPAGISADAAERAGQRDAGVSSDKHLAVGGHTSGRPFREFGR